jgi:hypothetical protein
MVERTTKRTTRWTTSATVPTGRAGSDWIPKELNVDLGRANRPFQFHKRSQLFIRRRNETFSVAQDRDAIYNSCTLYGSRRFVIEC